MWRHCTYPSVPRAEARAAVIEALNGRSNPEIPTVDVVRMMDTVLENNTISFNDGHFVQTEGTAIGSHLGMNYASTYLGAWEEEPLKRLYRKTLVYFRFVDDMWCLWTHGRDALLDFHTKGNQINPRLKLELSTQQSSSSFWTPWRHYEAEVYTQTSTQSRPTSTCTCTWSPLTRKPQRRPYRMALVSAWRWYVQKRETTERTERPWRTISWTGSTPHRSGPCVAQRCAICPYMIEADSFEDAADNKYTVKNSVDCKSSNVVYAVFMSGAGHTFMSGRPATRSTSDTCWTCRGFARGTLTRWRRTFTRTDTA